MDPDLRQDALSFNIKFTSEELGIELYLWD